MKLGASPWLKVVFLATGLVFVAVAVYLFGIAYAAWVESDATVPVLLAAKSLHAKSPVVTDWYYANGDLWVLTPHTIAMLPVAVLGVGRAALLVATVLGFALELYVLVRVFARYSRETWIALFAAMVTLVAWSNGHAAYAYIQLAYGFATVHYLLTFHVFARLAETERPRAWVFVAGAALVAMSAIGNPARGLVFLVGPVLVGCLWPWRSAPWSRRLAIAGTAIAGFAVAFGLYRWLAGVVDWSIPRGHAGFAFAGLRQMGANLAMFGRGLFLLCAAGDRSGVFALPGFALLAGAIVLVVREALAREMTGLRFACVAVLAQLGAVLVLLLAGNLLDGVEATRYVIPSTLSVLGLATVIAVRTVSESGWLRRVAIGWLALVPVAALVAATDVAPPEPRRGVWPDTAELDRLADELVRRGLTHGFADNLAANLITLDSGGAALTCRSTFADVLLPQRWLASAACFDPAALPETFFVVAYQDEGARKAVRTTLPNEVDRFHVGETYEVHVFHKQDNPTSWLALPIPDRELASFPMRLSATHLQVRREHVIASGEELTGTGEPGGLVYGPYIDLPKGDYIATWTGSGIASPGRLVFSVIGTPLGRERRALAPPVTREAREISPQRSELVRFAFTSKRPLAGVEVVVESADGARVTLHELVIERAPAR